MAYAHAHAKGTKVLLARNTYPPAGKVDPWRSEGYYAFEEPISLNLSRLLPEMIGAGVHAFKIEGRPRSKSYVRGVVTAFRAAIDDIRAGRAADIADLVALTEGQEQTQGAFETRKWR